MKNNTSTHCIPAIKVKCALSSPSNHTLVISARELHDEETDLSKIDGLKITDLDSMKKKLTDIAGE